MANLSIRKLDDKVYERLRLMAAKHGVSMEEEIRLILGQAVKVPDKTSDIFLKYFGPTNGIDLDIESRKTSHSPIDFDDDIN